MAEVRLSRVAVDMGQLPPICLCCDRPAVRAVRHRFYWLPTWYLVFWVFVRFGIGFVLGRYGTRNVLRTPPTDVGAPLCGLHTWRLKAPLYVLLALLVPCVVAVPLMIYASAYRNTSLQGFCAGLMFFGLIAAYLSFVVLSLVTPRMIAADERSITLTWVSRGFVRAAEIRQAGVEVGPQRALPGLGGVRPAKPFPLTAVLLGVGGLSIFSFCVVLPVTGYLVQRSRDTWRNQMHAQGPPEWMKNGQPPPWAQPMPPPQHSIRTTPPPTPPTSGIPAPPPPPPASSTGSSPDSQASRRSFDAGAAYRGPPGPDLPWNAVGRVIFARPNQNGPTVIPNNSTPVTPGQALSPGDKLWQLQGGVWMPVEMVELAGPDAVKVSRPQFAGSWAAVVPREQLRLVQAGTTGSTTPVASSATPPPPVAISTNRPAAELRTWTDVSGTFKIEAKLLSFADEKVQLQRADGKLITLPIAKLSEADQTYVRASQR